MRPRQSSLGIRLRRVVTSPPRRRFNEAEAIKPRNQEPGRQIHPGDSGFNEAEAIKPRNQPVRIQAQFVAQMRASMRPRQSSLGIAKLAEEFNSAIGASMRPRQSSLGISEGLSIYLIEPPASMRPRQSSLGITATTGASIRPHHGFNEAEAIKPRNHGWRHHISSSTYRRFNEAEAIKPRNHAYQQGSRLDVRHASMRPRQSSLGINPIGKPVLWK